MKTVQEMEAGPPKPEPVAPMPREKSKGHIPKGESTDAEHRDGAARSSDEVSVMGTERRDCIIQFYLAVNQEWEEPLDKTKPFDISKQVVWEAYLRVKANKGAAGVDAPCL